MSFSATSNFDSVRNSFLVDDGLPFADALTSEQIHAALDDPLADEPNRSDDDGTIDTPAVTLWAFLSQMLYKQEQRSCQAAVDRVIGWFLALGRKPPSDSTGTFCRARSRLSLAGIQQLVRQLADRREQELPAEWLWHGRHVHLVDGSTASMPDTEANQDEYPQQGVQKVGVGFPIARYVALISLVSGIARDLAMGKYMGKETGETALFRELLDRLNEGDVIVADRYYCSWFMIALIMERGVEVVFRLHQKRTADFHRGTRLGAGDHVVEWARPAKPEWMDDETYGRMPDVVEMREVDVQVSEKGFRTQSLVVVTTLTDAEEFPGADVASLYRQRW